MSVCTRSLSTAAVLRTASSSLGAERIWYFKDLESFLLRGSSRPTPGLFSPLTQHPTLQRHKPQNLESNIDHRRGGKRPSGSRNDWRAAAEGALKDRSGNRDQNASLWKKHVRRRRRVPSGILKRLTDHITALYEYVDPRCRPVPAPACYIPITV